MYRQQAYHGTINKHIQKILGNGFIISKSNSEWLGYGAYFFAEYDWAYQWAVQEANKKNDTSRLPATLQIELECADQYFFDLDIAENMEKIERETRYVISKAMFTGSGRVNLSSSQLRCLACNFYKLKHKIQVYAYTFSAFENNFIGFPIQTKKQRQICVTQDSTCCIKNIKEFKKEATDYAI